MEHSPIPDRDIDSHDSNTIRHTFFQNKLTNQNRIRHNDFSIGSDWRHREVVSPRSPQQNLDLNLVRSPSEQFLTERQIPEERDLREPDNMFIEHAFF